MGSARCVAVMVVLGSVAGGVVRPALADTAPASIAVPAIGTDGPASLYPSTMRVVPPGGPTQRGQISVVLNAVTHPCPEHLAVLLVQNHNTGFLLMSNAGGCRPLQGTAIRFTAMGTPAPFADNDPTTAPHPDLVTAAPSNYGAAPTFPAPAPPGPYTPGLPPATSFIGAEWQLFVIDTVSTMRGVIAGGWSIEYDTSPTFDAVQSNVSVPGGGGGATAGPAAAYPMRFDLDDVPRATVEGVVCAITLNHAFPDNLHLVLQSPAGTAVVLMANAGGSTDIAPGTTMTFAAGGGAVAPDAAPITTGVYRPGGVYGGTLALPAPAPQPPYATSFSAFDDEPARGAWRLWVYDDAALNTGAIEAASLTIFTEGGVSFTVPLPLAFTSDQPFVQFEGTVANSRSDWSFTWRNVVDGVFYDAGAFTRRSPSQLAAAVPLRRGTNVVTYYVRTTGGVQLWAHRTITVDQFAYFLAEGATGSFFDTDVTIANPTGTGVPVQIEFLGDGGGTVQLARSVPAGAPLQVRVDDHVPGAATSAVVRSTTAAPLAVERTMAWDTSGYGGHGGTAVAPAQQWLFAEGSQGYFSTYVLLANDNDAAAAVTLTFLLEGGGPVVHQVSVPARTRRTIYAGDLPALVNRSFGVSITSDRPIIAERAMYLPGGRLFEGGHGAAGVNRPSRTWFLAEGATGPFFDCFVLLGNPNATPATATLTYLLPTGATVTRDVVVPANGRTTINVETVDPQLANVPVSTAVVSNVEIVVERAMYWPGASVGWQEAHNSFGVAETGLRWGVADGRVGGERQHETYILLANPNPRAAEVSVRFLKSGLTVTRSYVLNPTSRVTIWVNRDVPELGAGTFAADVRVLNYQPIAVEKALYWNAGGVAWAAGTNVVATPLPPP